MLINKKINKRHKKVLAEEAELKKAEQKEEKEIEQTLANQENFKNEKLVRFERFLFSIDNTNKKLFVRSTSDYLLNFADIVSYELIEDGQSLTSGGNALAGGLLFGVAGAVVGSAMKGSQKNICMNMQLRITINDVMNPTIVYQLISPPGGAIKNGKYYTRAFEFAKEIIATLSVI